MIVSFTFWMFESRDSISLVKEPSEPGEVFMMASIFEERFSTTPKVAVTVPYSPAMPMAPEIMSPAAGVPVAPVRTEPEPTPV